MKTLEKIRQKSKDVSIALNTGAVMSSKNIQKNIRRGTVAFVIMSALMFIGRTEFLASAFGDIQGKVRKTAQDVYDLIIGVSNAIAVCLMAVALLVRLISKNPRAVEEATSWLKRIAVTWLALNCVGLIFKLVQGMAPESTVGPDVW